MVGTIAFGSSLTTLARIISGTPMAYGKNSLNGVLRFLRARLEHGKLDLSKDILMRSSFNQHPQLEQTLRAHLFWRNTKESIADEYNVPELVEVSCTV